MDDIRCCPSISTLGRSEFHTNSAAFLRVCSITVRKVWSIRSRISSLLDRYRGSQETMEQPVAVASALKLAGPSAQPRIRRAKSSSDSENMRLYSPRERPHGTTSLSLNITIRECKPEKSQRRQRSRFATSNGLCQSWFPLHRLVIFVQRWKRDRLGGLPVFQSFGIRTKIFFSLFLRTTGD